VETGVEFIGIKQKFGVPFPQKRVRLVGIDLAPFIPMPDITEEAQHPAFLYQVADDGENQPFGRSDEIFGMKCHDCHGRLEEAPERSQGLNRIRWRKRRRSKSGAPALHNRFILSQLECRPKIALKKAGQSPILH
jgi:hypothetical protein